MQTLKSSARSDVASVGGQTSPQEGLPARRWGVRDKASATMTMSQAASSVQLLNPHGTAVRPFCPAMRSHRSHYSSLRCRASTNQKPLAQPMSRRAATVGIASLPLVLAPFQAWALIPDDDDEDLVQSAKANRKKRIAEEKASEKQFAKATGLVDNELVFVQKAITRLAKSGSELESGDLKAVSATLRDSWVDDFSRASASLSTSEATKASASAILDGISSLSGSASQGSLSGAKKSFVKTVTALRTWASEAGVAGGLVGL